MSIERSKYDSEHPLYKAVVNDDLAEVTRLLNEHDINAKYDTALGVSASLLHIAIDANIYNKPDKLKNNYEIIKLLIDKGAKLDAVDNKNVSPLHYAVQAGNMEILKLLIDKNADVNAVTISMQRHCIMR